MFPAAPVFSFITNFLEIRVKLNSMMYYSKRTIAEPAHGIGSWLPIMELISMICIPINVAIVFLTGYVGEPSVLVQALQKNNKEFWTDSNILIFLISMEHLVLALKIVMAILIPDVPDRVIFEESQNG